MHKYLLGVSKLDAWDREELLKEIERVYWEKTFDNLMIVMFVISMILLAASIFG